jgi:transposase InsO family protein
MPWKKTEPMNQRKEFVLKAIHASNFRQLCEEYGISTKTGYKWRERFYQYGYEGMMEVSRRPLGHAKELGEAVICEIVRLKNAHPTWGPRKLRDIYQRLHGQVPSESSFKRVLERAGLVAKRRVRHRTEAGRIGSGRKASAPNQIWTVDFKGWWHGTNGQRCEPLTVRDECTRYVLDVRAVADARTETMRVCFERLFERNGLPEAIRSDNGVPFASSTGVLGLSKLSAWWVALGIDLERGRPGCPQDNGRHERMHRTLKEATAKPPQATVRLQQKAFHAFQREYNEERPHAALDNQTPRSCYQASARCYPRRVPELEYGDDMETRVISQQGSLKWKGERTFISEVFAYETIGIKPLDERWMEFYFGPIRLGWFDSYRHIFSRRKPKALILGPLIL